jgi:hypothetical protein
MPRCTNDTEQIGFVLQLAVDSKDLKMLRTAATNARGESTELVECFVLTVEEMLWTATTKSLPAKGNWVGSAFLVAFGISFRHCVAVASTILGTPLL